MFQSLLNWILANCILPFGLGDDTYELGSTDLRDMFIVGVNFGFWVILAFSLCFFIKLVKWCVRKCLRK